MSEYIPFTDEQKEKARRTDLAGLLRSQGETLRKSGSELEWLDGSQKVTIRGNLWFHQYEQVGGDSIDFVRKFYHKSYPEAMKYLLGQSGGVLSVLPPVQKAAPKFEPPPANDNMRRVFAYLLSRRGIDKDVLYAFVHKKMIYESAQYHNVVFVGFDKDGIPRHANKRGTGSVSTYFVYDEAAWRTMLLGILRAALWGMSMPQILRLLAKGPRIACIAATDGRYGGATGLLGRNEDMLWFEDDLGHRDFLHPLAIEGFCVEGLRDYQFQQTDKDSFIMLAEKTKSGLETVIQAEIAAQMRGILEEKGLGYVGFSVEFVHGILPDPSTGKKQLIVKNLAEGWLKAG